jgi:phosphoglycolate phosphatase-like HAD superfamily hydrolase
MQAKGFKDVSERTVRQTLFVDFDGTLIGREDWKALKKTESLLGFEYREDLGLNELLRFSETYAEVLPKDPRAKVRADVKNFIEAANEAGWSVTIWTACISPDAVFKVLSKDGVIAHVDRIASVIGIYEIREGKIVQKEYFEKEKSKEYVLNKLKDKPTVIIGDSVNDITAFQNSEIKNLLLFVKITREKEDQEERRVVSNAFNHSFDLVEVASLDAIAAGKLFNLT